MQLETAFENGFGVAADLPDTTLVALTDASRWRCWADAAQALNSADERERANRQRKTEEREVRTFAYALQRCLLARVLGLAPLDVPLTRDRLGSPRVTGDAAYTSLSHAGQLVAVAVDLAGPVGIDLELRERAGAMAEIAHEVCHPHELAGMRGEDDPDAIALTLLATWVRKEAFLKAEGIGLQRAMRSFVAADGARLASEFHPGLHHQIHMLDAGQRCVAALAAAPGRRVHCAWLVPPF